MSVTFEVIIDGVMERAKKEALAEISAREEGSLLDGPGFFFATAKFSEHDKEAIIKVRQKQAVDRLIRALTAMGTPEAQQ